MRRDKLKSTNLKVFVDENGKSGDSVPVVTDEGRKIRLEERIKIASKLDAVETVFINSVADNNISIVHSLGEIPFAGTVAIGAAWFLSDTKGQPISSLQGRDGVIEVHQQDGITWVKADLSTMPEWNIEQLDSLDAVEAMKADENKDIEHTMFWAWANEEKGLIRAKTFASDWGIPEAEANGSGAMLLASKLDREIEMIQGKGSVVYAKPELNNQASVGGKVTAESKLTTMEKKYHVDSFDDVTDEIKKLHLDEPIESKTIHYYAQLQSKNVKKLVVYSNRCEIHILKESDGKFEFTDRIEVKDQEQGFGWLRGQGYNKADVVEMSSITYLYQNGRIGLYTINEKLRSVILDFPEPEQSAIEAKLGLENEKRITVPYNKYLTETGNNIEKELS